MSDYSEPRKVYCKTCGYYRKRRDDNGITFNPECVLAKYRLNTHDFEDEKSIYGDPRIINKDNDCGDYLLWQTRWDILIDKIKHWFSS